MQSIRQIQRLNDIELEKCVPPNASWHTDYRDTAYIYIGGLPFELSEGDVLTIFSQYGNPAHINLMRDKDTGKSRGFAWLKYEDQRSCDLAVDNLSGASVLGRVLSVDHTRYKLKDDEIEGQGLEEGPPELDDDTDREGDSRRKRRRTSSVEGDRRPMLKEEVELAQLLKTHDDDDPMKAYLIKEKREEVAEALKQLSVSKHSSKHKTERSSRRKDDERRHRHRSQDRDRYNDNDGRSRRHRDDSQERDDKRRRRRSRDTSEERYASRRDKDRDRGDHQSDDRRRRWSPSREHRRDRSR